MKVRWEKGNENLGCHRTALIVFEHIQIRSGKYRGIRDRHWVWQASSNSPMAQVGHNRTNKVTSGAVTPQISRPHLGHTNTRRQSHTPRTGCDGRGGKVEKGEVKTMSEFMDNKHKLEGQSLDCKTELILKKFGFKKSQR